MLKQDDALSEDLMGLKILEDGHWFASLPQHVQRLIDTLKNHEDARNRLTTVTEIADKHVGRFLISADESDINAAIAIYILVVQYTRPLDPHRQARLGATAFTCQYRWEKTDALDDLDVAIHFFRLAKLAAAPTRITLAASETDLACALQWRWLRTKTDEDRNEAKESFHHAVELARDHVRYAQVLTNYGECIRLMATNVYLDQIKEAAEIQQRAVAALRPSLPIPYAKIWRNAAMAKYSLFCVTGDKTTSAQSLEYFQESLRLVTSTVNPEYVYLRVDTARLHAERFRRFNEIEDTRDARGLFEDVLSVQPANFAATIGKADALRNIAALDSDLTRAQVLLDEACTLAEKAITLVKEDKDSRGWAYHRASIMYLDRFELEARSSFLDRAIEVSKLSMTYTGHDALWSFHYQCAQACRQRYILFDRLEDLESAFEAIAAAMDIIDKSDGYQRTQCSRELGLCHLCRYKRFGKSEELENALKWSEAACSSDSQVDKASAQNDVANVLMTELRHVFSVDALDRAIEMYRVSFQNFMNVGSRAGRGNVGMVRGGLGQALLERYLRWGLMDELTSAIRHLKEAVKDTHKSSPRYPLRVGNLVYGLTLKYHALHDMSLITEAQKFLLDVLNLPFDPAPHVSQSMNLHLGNTYILAFETTRSWSDLELGLSCYQKVQDIGDADSDDAQVAEVMMAVALRQKASRSKELEDFERSIAAFDQSQRFRSSDQYKRLFIRMERAKVLQEAYHKLNSLEHGRRALSEFSDIAITPSVTTDILLGAAEAAALLEHEITSNACKAYEHIMMAVSVFPTTIMMNPNRIDQLRTIRKYHNLPSSATALASAAGVPPAKILTTLEHTRSFLWDRYLLLETPLDKLRDTHEELARQFDLTRRKLVATNALESGSSLETALSGKDIARIDRQATATDFDRILKTIRNQQGFENFLNVAVEPDNSSRWRHDYPIVYFNMSEYRCDAFVMDSKDVHHLALSELRMTDVFEQVARLLLAQQSLDTDFEAARSSFDEVMLWLWTVAAEPVLNFIHSISPDNQNEAHRRTAWVSADWLSVLPIHAAGDWISDDARDRRASVHERAISSYVPSAQAIAFLRQRAEALESKSSNDAALLVGMPSTPGMDQQQDLDAETEVGLVASVIDDQIPWHTELRPTLNDVVPHLPTSQLMHFACHGVADTQDPLKSAVRLADWQQNPLNVRRLMQIDLQSCHLAFLMACETGANKDIKLRNEGLHVAGAFNMAGVPHAVAGLWRVSDAASLGLTTAFYMELFRDKAEGQSRYRRTAEALHRSVDALREQGHSVILWGAFVHFGV